MTKIDDKFIGTVKELSSEDHHKTIHIGFTDLKRAIQSLRHFKAGKDGLIEVTPQQLRAFDLGTAMHSTILEQDMSDILVGPEVSTKAVKAWKEFVAANPDKTVLTKQEYEKVKMAFEAVAEHPIAEKMISNAEIETSHFSKDNETGLMLCARPDGVNSDAGYMFDYKTSISANEFDFTKSIARFAYHLQAAHYIDIYESVTGNKINNYYFIVQEKSAPYAVNVIELDQADINAAMVIRRDLLNRISVAYKTNDFPAYTSEIKKVTLPDWAYTFQNNQYAEVF